MERDEAENKERKTQPVSAAVDRDLGTSERRAHRPTSKQEKTVESQNRK